MHCNFTLKMHENEFGGQALPEPAGGTKSAPQRPRLDVGEGIPGWGRDGNGWGEEEEGEPGNGQKWRWERER